MKNSLSLLLSLGCCVINQGISLKTATAQITPDGTTNTTVDVSGNDFIINNGDKAGGNLFHSFSEFSVPTDGSGLFNNAADIVNIFSRVTGGNISNIDGFLRANGTANLFLINPAGIIFGEGARVDIGGSFYGSTADSIIFPDGELSATNLADPPLITINAPIGLNFRDNPGDITVRGSGLGQRLDSRLIDTEEAFRINSDAIFALVGGKINLQRATIKTIRGQIEIGSVAENEQVTLNPIDQRFNLDYGNVQNFDNISLDASQIESSTLQDGNGGNIKITANSVNITDSAFIATRTSGTGNAGDIDVNAGAFNLSDSSITTNTFGTGNAGNITVNAGSVNINNSSVTADTSGRGNAGAIDIEVTDAGAFNLSRSSITTRSFGTGNGGSIDVSSGSVNITDSSITTRSFGTGNGGSINVSSGSVNISDSFINTNAEQGDGGNILIEAFLGTRIANTEIDAVASGDGRTGNITIEALNESNLELISDGDVTIATNSFGGFPGEKTGGNLNLIGGQITIHNYKLNTSVNGQGDGGNLSIKGNSINITNSSITAETSGLGNAGAIDIDVANAGSFNLSDSSIFTRTFGTGNAGDINVKAGAFNLSDSSITTNTFGTGNAGNITVNAGSVNINNSSVTADTSGRGNAGAIDIEVTDAGSFNLSRSSITTRSFGTGNAGNITVNAGSVNINNSSVTADTSGRGNAGAIDIEVTDAGSFNLSDSSITTSTFRTGNGGSIDVSSGLVNITNSSSISTETSGIGNAGTIDIDVTNAGPFNLSDSSITTSTFGTGNGGSIDVSSGSVNITNSSINTNSEQGNGGSINVTSGSLTLDQGEISAQTNSGNGGSLDIDVDNDLLMRNNSQISTNALTNGNGGDITINARFIIGFPSTGLGNDIRSDSKQRGEGGNINIKTKGGIFNFKISSDTAGIFNNTNDIDASSEFGLDGNVSIENPDNNELQGMNRLLTNPVSAETIATDVCSSTGDGSRLIYKGRGGVTPPPTAPLTAEALISDGQPITVDQETELDSLVEGKLENIPEDPNYIPEDIKPIKISIGDIYPARGIIKTENGEIILTAYPTKDINTRTPHKSANCG